jgi:hypothetical protein
MDHEPTFYLLKHRLPPSESANLLGRIISRYQDPTLEYTPESPSATLSQFNDFLLPPQHDHNARLTTQTTHSSSRHLKYLTRLSSSQTTTAATTVTSPCITTRRLKREQDYFDALKAVPDVRRKMLEMCPVGGRVYLVVGTMSLRAGTFHRTALAEGARSVGVAVPMGIAAAAAGVSLPGIGDALPGVDVGVRRAGSVGSRASFETGVGGGEDGGEEVFAVACKVVKRTWRELGRGVTVRSRQPEYRGGQHFGESDEDSDEMSDEEGELGEEEEAALAEGFELGDVEDAAFGEDAVSLVDLLSSS